ncbi:type II secretion system F family protein [Sinomonas mesophila]|uniref:type II secretion system F family protein n=1 Tax=Sinomonas mesophila TaxID=1531955 RepID=UPI0009874151|nr:hypothetical protein [Sinomonas mesophila]
MSALASAAIVASALFGAALLLRPVRRGPAAVPAAGRPGALPPGRLGTGRGRSGVRRRGSYGLAEDLQRASLLVAQIAALLRAGRSPAHLWAQAAAISASDAGAGRGGGDRRGRERMLRGAATPPPGGRPGRVGRTGATWEETSSKVLAGAARAASLGRPVGAAIRTAAGAAPGAVPLGGAGGRPAAIWGNVAACVETAEASGSPLAAVLDRLAAHFEADADAAAARAVALAGPKATAKVLSVLPVAGLGLGILMGADPFGLLISTPLGAGCLGLGALLMLVGRWWSSRLVNAASEER